MRLAISPYPYPRNDYMTAQSAVRRLSVLVVDDNRDAADTLVLFLRLSGHDARVAYTGAQALAALRDWRPDVAVLDIVMQDVDGVDLAARMRAEADQSILLLAVTGVGTNDEVARVKAGTFDHIFLKPVNPDDLLRLLTSHSDRPIAPDRSTDGTT